MLRRNFANFSDLKLGGGFSTKRAELSRFIQYRFVKEEYWRDVTSRSAMDERWNAFHSPISQSVDESKMDIAFEKVLDLFQSHYSEPLNTVTIEEAIQLLPSDTSAGAPYLPGVKKGEVRNHLKAMSRYAWRNLESKGFLPVTPAIAAARRTIRAKGTNKPRLVFAYPGYLNIIETQFTAAFSENAPPFLGWSVNWLDYGTTYDDLVRRIYSGRVWMNLDFSSFDSTVSAYLIRIAFQVVEELMDLSDLEKSMLDELMTYFIHTPLSYYNSVEYKHRGIPSGSGFTQLIGSIVNMLACVYAFECSPEYGDLVLSSCIWLGDDSCLTFRYGPPKDEVEDFVIPHLRRLGLQANPEKTLYNFVSPSMQYNFLGRKAFLGVRYWEVDLDKLHAQICFPEFQDKSISDVIQRLIGLTWAFGCNLDAYEVLNEAYDFCSRYKRNETEDKINYKSRRLLQMYGIQDVNLSVFPSYEEICYRYYGTVLYPPRLIFEYCC
nr:RNA-dependent RNA polymerase [Saccharomyces cerevisiae cryspovirus 1]